MSRLKSVVANKFLCSWTKTEFHVFVNVSHAEVTTGSDYYLRRKYTRINSSEHEVVNRTFDV